MPQPPRLASSRAAEAEAAAKAEAAAEAAAVRAALQAALGDAPAGCGEAVVHGALLGLADTVPEPSLPCVADVIAPMLHLPAWRDGDRLRAWSTAAIAALPSADGAPDARCREVLLQLLLAFPDCCGGGPGGKFQHRPVGVLGTVLTDFARVARRLQPGHSFDAANYTM